MCDKELSVKLEREGRFAKAKYQFFIHVFRPKITPKYVQKDHFQKRR